MKASALPASPPPAPAAPVAPADPAAASADTAATGNNFVGMLMQLLGGSAPSSLTTAAATTTTKAVDTDAESEDPTALAAMLAMPVQAPLPWNALPTTGGGSGEGGDALELLGLGSGSAGGKTADLGTLLALKSDAADASPDDAAPAAPDTNDSIGSLSPLTDLNAAKAPHAEVPASRHVQAPVGSPQWAEELGSKLSLMVDRNQHSASLKLSPDNLGPLEVRISITDDKASVWFGAAHADTRAAIEHALPKLREMLASTGLSLGDTGVFREPPRDQQASSPRHFSGGSESASSETEMVVSTRSLSLLDAYA